MWSSVFSLGLGKGSASEKLESIGSRKQSLSWLGKEERVLGGIAQLRWGAMMYSLNPKAQGPGFSPLEKAQAETRVAL